MVEIAVEDVIEGEQSQFYERRDSDAYTNAAFTFFRKRVIVSLAKRKPAGDGDGPFDHAKDSEDARGGH